MCLEVDAAEEREVLGDVFWDEMSLGLQNLWSATEMIYVRLKAPGT